MYPDCLTSLLFLVATEDRIRPRSILLAIIQASPEGLQAGAHLLCKLVNYTREHFLVTKLFPSMCSYPRGITLPAVFHRGIPINLDIS